MLRISLASLLVWTINAVSEPCAAKLSWKLPLNDVGTGGDEKRPLSLVAALLTTVYTLKVRVGTQNFNLTLDTNAQAAVLFHKDFTPIDNACGNGLLSRNLFDPSASSTFKDTNSSVRGWGLPRYPYIGNTCTCNRTAERAEEVYGTWAADSIEFGNLTVSDASFALLRHTYYPLNNAWPSDGILGLGLPLHAEPSAYSAVGQILSNFDSKQITLWLGSDHPQSNGQPDGQITFGSRDKVNCENHWAPVFANSDDWSVMLNGAHFGNDSIVFGARQFARISIASPFLEVPRNYFLKMTASLNATYNHDADLYAVECHKVKDMPDLRLNIGQGFGIMDYAVSSSSFTLQVGSQCLLLIGEGGDGWKIGPQFFPKRCLHLDYDMNWISFADPVKKRSV